MVSINLSNLANALTLTTLRKSEKRNLAFFKKKISNTFFIFLKHFSIFSFFFNYFFFPNISFFQIFLFLFSNFIFSFHSKLFRSGKGPWLAIIILAISENDFLIVWKEESFCPFTKSLKERNNIPLRKSSN